VVGRDGPHEKIATKRVGLLRRAGALARRGLFVPVSPGWRAPGLVALQAVRLVVVERIVELRRL